MTRPPEPDGPLDGDALAVELPSETHLVSDGSATTPVGGPGWQRKSDPTEGPTLDRYELLAVAGRGAMGVVYRGRHRALGRTVAVKLLLPGASPERFIREARLLAAVRSPHVVAVTDYDVLPDGRPILVMDWIDGGDLRAAAVAADGKLDEPQATAWMEDVCRGLAAAAEAGVTHRDVKPSNLLIGADGRAQVADFGLARSADPDLLISMTGNVLGTPFYMAPEQAEDPRSADVRSDIYGFGATFYHLLTGRPPFEGPSAFAVLLKHKSEPLVTPQVVNSALSDHVSELIERCLAKSPDDRFASFRDVLSAIRRVGVSPWDREEDAALRPYLDRYRNRRATYLDQTATLG